MSSWQESAGRITRSFNDWYLVDRDQRAFLRRGLEFSKDAYDRIWDDIAHQPGDPDGPDLPDLFDAAIGGLWPNDFEWMHLAGVTKDAVTNFEVYLEHVADEVMASHGKRFERERSAPWDKLVSFWQMFHVEVDGAPVAEMRTLRHILTHRRGDLRTKEQRDQFGSSEPFMDSVAHLEADGIEARMDALAAVVRTVDPVAYDHTWGRNRSEAIISLDDDPLVASRRTRTG